MAIASKRRWHQFGLRTMFVVVTVFAVLLGWELKFVRERQAFIKRVRDNNGIVGAKSQWNDLPDNPHADSPDIPFWRKWLGDDAVIVMGLGNGYTPEDVDEMRRLFPEGELLPKPE